MRTLAQQGLVSWSTSQSRLADVEDASSRFLVRLSAKSCPALEAMEVMSSYRMYGLVGCNCLGLG